MARVDHLAGGIYRISTYAPAKRISFNQFLIQDEKPALIHTGTFPMYDDVRAAVAQVLDPSRLHYMALVQTPDRSAIMALSDNRHHAARTAFQVLDTVLSLTRSLPRLN